MVRFAVLEIVDDELDQSAPELDALLAAYQDDSDAAFAYTRARGAFRLHRDAGSPPRELNPHVPGYLTGRKPLPHRLPNCIGFGDETEAIDYAATDFADGEQRFRCGEMKSGWLGSFQALQ